MLFLFFVCRRDRQKSAFPSEKRSRFEMRSGIACAPVQVHRLIWLGQLLLVHSCRIRGLTFVVLSSMFTWDFCFHNWPTAYFSTAYFGPLSTRPISLSNLLEFSFLRFALLFNLLHVWSAARTTSMLLLSSHIHCPYCFAFSAAPTRCLLVAGNVASFFHFALTPRSRSFPLNVFLVI